MKGNSTIKQISKTIVLGIAFMAAYLLLAFAGQAHAADFKGLLISPANQRIELKNGQVYSGEMNVQNTTDNTMNVEMSVGSYSIENSNYNSPNYDSESKYSLIKDWIRLDQDTFELAAGASQIVRYTVVTPANPPAGMQYATIFASNIPEESNQTGVTAIGRVGLVLSATMLDGETVEKYSIQNEKIAGYQPTAPLKASFAIKNEGNIGTDVSYSLKVKSAINGTEVYSSKVQSDSVFPESTRTFNLEWDQVGIGFYNVEMNVNIGGRDHKTTKLVCTIPIWIIILVIIAVICLIAYFVINYRMRKEAQENRKTTSKANKAKKTTKKTTKK